MQAAPALAVQVQRFELLADGPLTVQVGQSLGFTLLQDIDTYHSNRDVPGDPEPGPIFIGEQSWFHGRSEHSNEWLVSGHTQLSLSDGRSASFNSSAEDIAWQVTWQFNQPGRYTVSANGAFDFVYLYYYWTNTSTRGCFFFICGGWDHHPIERRSNSGWTSYAGAAPLTITVVPEPATALLWAVGVAALGVARFRRRGAAPAQPGS